MKHKTRILLLTIIVQFFISCSKQDETLVPSYIFVDTMSVNIEEMQGSASHNISDVWVTNENGLIGAFELPAHIPVLQEGETKLIVYAGIKLNGISGTRVYYPFYEPLNFTAKLGRDSVVNLTNLKVKYADFCKFVWIEDFESENFSFRTTTNGKVPLKRITESSEIFKIPGETNKSSVKAVLTNDSTYLEYSSFESFKLPADGTRESFLELNYRNNAEFVVGLFVNGTFVEQRPVVVVNPSEEWNKIYINLTNAVNENNTANNFRIYIKMVKPDDVESAYLYLDNIKLIHRAN